MDEASDGTASAPPRLECVDCRGRKRRENGQVGAAAGRTDSITEINRRSTVDSRTGGDLSQAPILGKTGRRSMSPVSLIANLTDDLQILALFATSCIHVEYLDVQCYTMSGNWYLVVYSSRCSSGIAASNAPLVTLAWIPLESSSRTSSRSSPSSKKTQVLVDTI